MSKGKVCAILLLLVALGVAVVFALSVLGVFPAKSQSKITFYDGDTVYQTLEVDSDGKVTMPADPQSTEDGKKFIDWYIDDTYTTTLNSYLQNNKLSGDITVYAKYAEPYKVRYIDGENIEVVETKEAKFTLKTLKDDYIDFEGWYTSADFKADTKIETTDFKIDGETIVVYAKWAYARYTLTEVIKYNWGVDKKVDETNTIKTSKSKLVLKDYVNPEVAGVFTGWYSDLSKTNKITQVTFSNEVQAITIYAKFDQAYRLNVYNLMGATVNINSQDIKGRAEYCYSTDSNGKVTLSNKLVYGNFEFLGWYTDKDYTQKFTESTSDTITINLTNYDNCLSLYAKWNTSSYKINYNTNGGTSNSLNQPTSSECMLNSSYKVGYKFLGWYTDSACTTKLPEKYESNLKEYKQYVTFSPDKREITVYAKWQLISYTIHYVIPAGATNSNPVDTGKTTYTYNIEKGNIELELLNDISADVTFAGWYTLQGRNVTKIGEEVIQDYGYIGDTKELGYGVVAKFKYQGGSFTVDESGTTITGVLDRDITEIVIPGSITEISDNAFSGLTKLTSVDMSQATDLKTIGRDVFTSCSNLKTISLPNTIESIGEYAFYDCKALNNITLPTSLQNIKKGAFKGCSSLTEVELPQNVSLSDEIFAHCTALTEVTMNKSITAIPYYAFYGCTSLKNIYLPSTVTSIAEGAFFGCSGLENIYIEGFNRLSLTTNAFYDCGDVVINFKCSEKDLVLPTKQFYNKRDNFKTYGTTFTYKYSQTMPTDKKKLVF